MGNFWPALHFWAGSVLWCNYRRCFQKIGPNIKVLWGSIKVWNQTPLCWDRKLKIFDTEIGFVKRNSTIHDPKQWNYNSFELFTSISHPQTVSITDAQLVGINLFVDLIQHHGMQRPCNVIFNIWCIIAKNSQPQTNQFKPCNVSSFSFFFFFPGLTSWGDHFGICWKINGVMLQPYKMHLEKSLEVWKCCKQFSPGSRGYLQCSFMKIQL